MDSKSFSNQKAAESVISSAARFAQNIVAGKDPAKLFSAASNSKGLGRNSDQGVAMSNVDAEATSAKHDIDTLNYLSDSYRDTTKASVDGLSLKAKIQIQNSMGGSLINRIVDRYQNHLTEVVYQVKINNLIISARAEIKASNLLKAQKQMADNDVKNVSSQTQDSLKNAIDRRAVRDAFLDGCSAVRGALSSYVSIDKNNVNHLMSQKTAYFRHRINSKHNFSLAAKSLANQEINHIQHQLKRKLDTTSNLRTINWLVKKGQLRLRNALIDNESKFRYITNFDGFVRQSKDIINHLSTIKLDNRELINHQINQVKNSVEHEIAFRESTSVDSKIDDCEHEIASVVLKNIVVNGRNQIYSDYSYMNEFQKIEILNHIHHSASQAQQYIQSDRGNAIEIDLFKSVQIIQNLIAKTYDSAFRNRLVKAISHAKQSVNQIHDLPAKTRHTLILKINTLQHRLSLRPNRDLSQLSINQLHRHDQALQQQLRSIVNQSILQASLARVSRVTRECLIQISHSNLFDSQKDSIAKRIRMDSRIAYTQVSDDKTNRNSIKINCNANVSKITDDLKSGLMSDKDNDFSRINRLTDQARRLVNSLTEVTTSVESDFNAQLDSIYQRSNREINETDQISIADWIEQRCENQITEVVSEVIGRLDSDKRSAFTLILRNTKQPLAYIDASNLSLSQKHGYVSLVNRKINTVIWKIFKLRRKSRIHVQIEMLLRTVHQLTNQILQADKRNDLHQIEQATQNAYDSVSQSNRLSDDDLNRFNATINQIRMSTTRKINDSRDIIVSSQIMQSGKNKLNATVNDLIGNRDDFKRNAHIRIRRFVHSAVSLIQNDFEIRGFDQQKLINQIHRVMGLADQRVNQDKDRDVDGDVVTGKQRVVNVLRQVVVQQLTSGIETAHAIINRMGALQPEKKARSIQAVNYINQVTIDEVNKATSFKLIYQIEVDSRSKINTIINQISNLDPVKKTGHEIIDSLKRQLIKHFGDDQDLTQNNRKKIVDRVRAAALDFNRQIDQADDRHIKPIINRGRKRFSDINNRYTRHSCINRINLVVENAKHQVNKMKNLTMIENHATHSAIDRHYHQAIHDIRNAKGAIDCIQAEKEIEKKINHAFDQAISSNSFKQAAHDAINHDANKLKDRIKHMSNLAKQDKTEHCQELDKCQKLIDQHINNSEGIHNVYVVENNGVHLLHKQFGQISTENVIQSAIQSARNRIAHSDLGDEQKRLAQKEIGLVGKRNHQTSQSAQNNHRPASANGAKSRQNGKQSGYQDGNNGQQRQSNFQHSKEYSKAYQDAYQSGHQKYTQDFRNGYHDGRIRGVLSKPMIKFKNLSSGYTHGYMKAYQKYHRTLPFWIFAKKAIPVFQTPVFRTSSRIQVYRKHRFPRSFKILRVVMTHRGFCYRIADGYIPATPQLVTREYHFSRPINVKVVAKSGIATYRHRHFTAHDRFQTLSTGARVKAVSLVHDGPLVRFKLTSGSYITSDKDKVKRTWF